MGKRAIRDDCLRPEDEERYGKRRRLDTPPFDDWKHRQNQRPLGDPKPQATMFNLEATQLPEELQKKLVDRTGVINSGGVGQPTYPLSRIHEIFTVDTFLWDRLNRTQSTEMVAPLGPRAALSFQPNTWLFACAGRTRTNSMRPGKHSVHGFGDVVVFDAVNGLARDERIYFVGSSRTAWDATDSNVSDASVTGATGGTVTGVNTGPTTLLPGKIAMWLGTPYTIKVNGTLRPGIRQDGVHPDKFRPMIVMADDLLGPDTLIRAQKLAAEAVEAEKKRAPRAVDDNRFREMWRQARQKMRSVVIDQSIDEQTASSMLGDIMWLDQYLEWQLWRECHMKKMFVAGAAEVLFNRIEENHWKMASINNYAMSLAVHTATKYNSLTKAKRRRHIDMRLAQAFADHLSQIRSRCMGRIMNLSPPGGPLDLALGYFTA